MGRLVIQQDIVEDNIQKYTERATSQYTTLIESTPIFGIYYHQNRVFTTNDLGLENVEDDLGRDSPLKYEKIDQFPFYGLDAFSLNIERADIGLDSNIEGEALILPNTIKPYPNDYFCLYSIGERYLFKITEYQEDMIKSKPFYRINFRFSKILDEDTSSDIQEQVIEEYTTIFDNIGTEDKCIIKSSVFSSLDYMHKIRDNLVDNYIRFFYDKINNVMVIKNNVLDKKIYNKYLNKFLIDNDLLKKSKEFYSTMKLLEYIPTDSVFDFEYEKSIYYAMETQSVVQFFSRFFTVIDIKYPHVPWVRSNIRYYDLVMFGDEDEYAEKIDDVIEYFSKEFYGRIKLDMRYEADIDYYMENLIIDWIHNRVSIPSKETLDLINKNIWRNDMRSYVFIPLILFIFKKAEDAEIKRL